MAPRTKDKTEEEHFWERCRRLENGCLEFVGQPSCRYPGFRYRGKTQKVHRVSYQIKNGKIPAGLNVCHSCDFTRCVEPGHLFIATQAENIADMVRKGRHGATRNPSASIARLRGKQSNPGEKNPAAILSVDQVIEMRRRRQDDRATYSVLMAEFGISKSQVARIVKGTSWR